MFVFGVDANDIGRLREERKNFKVNDPRWDKIMQFLTSSTFEKGLFQVQSQLSAGVPCLYLMNDNSLEQLTQLQKRWV